MFGTSREELQAIADDAEWRKEEERLNRIKENYYVFDSDSTRWGFGSERLDMVAEFLRLAGVEFVDGKFKSSYDGDLTKTFGIFDKRIYHHAPHLSRYIFVKNGESYDALNCAFKVYEKEQAEKRKKELEERTNRILDDVKANQASKLAV